MCKILPFLRDKLGNAREAYRSAFREDAAHRFSCLFVDHNSCLFADLVDFSTIFRKTMLCYTPNRKRKEYTP